MKIAKWNDSNFWAMKQAADKSHHTLHKFVRRYEVLKRGNAYAPMIFAYSNILSLCEILAILNTYLCNLVSKCKMGQIHYTKRPYAGTQITITY